MGDARYAGMRAMPAPMANDSKNRSVRYVAR
jgi:hypothetical protein